MSNAMKYIRDLEAVGFGRDQAEAQVQMVLDALEGDLVTKGDFATFQESFRNEFRGKFVEIENKFDKKFIDLENKFALSQQSLQLQVQLQIKESEFRMTSRLGALIVGTAAIGVPLLTWLIKV